MSPDGNDANPAPAGDDVARSPARGTAARSASGSPRAFFAAGAPWAGRRMTLLFLAVCALGVSTMMTQLALMRELLSAFSGNEMVFGVILGSWFLLTGLGAWLGGTASKLRHPIRALIVAELLVAVLPLADVFLLRTLRNVVFLRGAMVGVTETVAGCLVLLLPYCLVSGYLLTLACSVLASQRSAASIGRVYFLDSLGDILGGLLFTFVLIHVFGHFGILYVPALLNLGFALAVSLAFRARWLLCVSVAVTVGLVTLMAAVDLDAVSTRLQFAGQHVVYRGSSPYGDLVVTETAGQYNFMESGVPLFSTDNIEEVEETVHYAMAQRPEAERVLLISGGASGTAAEVLKYGVRDVTCVELDPLIIEVARRFVPSNLADPRIRVVNTDGRLFVKRTAEQFDVVIADLPDPATSQINRLYTRQFFSETMRILRPGGVFATSVGHYENYLGDELARLIAVTHRTLSDVFDTVLIVPGGQVFFLASDGPLTSDMAARIERAGVTTQLVRRSYLAAVMAPDRLADIQRAVAEPAPANTDFSPVLYYYHLLYWMSQFRVRFGVLEGLLAVGVAAYLFRTRAVPFAVFTTGFAAAALEVVILMGFQILYGSVYHKVGLIVTMFMVGLALGSWIMNRMLPRRTATDLVKLEFVLAAYAALLPLALIALAMVPAGAVSAVAAQAALPVLTLGLAMLVGMEFPLASRADFRGVASTASRLYTADFVGAGLGALLVSTLLIPLVGVVYVCLLIAGLNLVSGTILWSKTRT